MIKSTTLDSINFKIIEGFDNKISFKDLKWAIKNKTIPERFEVGDIIFVKKMIKILS